MHSNETAKLEQARSKEEEELAALAALNPSLSFEQAPAIEKEELIIHLWDCNKKFWDIYMVCRQYTKSVFAGMGQFVGEELDTNVLLAACKALGYKKKKLLEVLELLPYLHNTVVNRKLQKLERESKETKDGYREET